MSQIPKLKKYFEALSKAVKESDGEALAECLRVPALHRKKKNQHVFYLNFDAELKKVERILSNVGSWKKNKLKK